MSGDESFNNLTVQGSLSITPTTPPPTVSSKLSIFSPLTDQAEGMIHLRVTDPMSTGANRLLSVAKRNSFNTARLNWIVETTSGDAPGLSVSNALNNDDGTSSNSPNLLHIAWDGKVGIGSIPSSTQLEVAGTVKATSFQGDGSTLDGVVKKAGDTINGALTVNNTLTVSGNVKVNGQTVIDSDAGWHRSYGNAGWYNGTYGGGWYMADSTWIRSYGGKNIYHDTGILRTDGILQVGPNGNRFVVNTSGNVGIGTTQARTPLHVLGRISTGLDFTSAGAITFFPPDGFAWFHIDNGPAGGRSIGRLRISHGGNPGDNEIISILQNMNVGIGTPSPGYKLDVAGPVHASSWPSSSDARFKTNVTKLTNVLEKLENIRGVSFDWNELYESLGRSTGHREIGLIAQEVEAEFPELVTTWGDESYRAIDYSRVTGVLIEAIKELTAENKALKQRIEALERATEKK